MLSLEEIKSKNSLCNNCKGLGFEMIYNDDGLYSDAPCSNCLNTWICPDCKGTGEYKINVALIKCLHCKTQNSIQISNLDCSSRDSQYCHQCKRSINYDSIINGEMEVSYDVETLKCQRCLCHKE